MNEQIINIRKNEIAEAIKNGTPLRNAVAPAKLLALINYTDPVNFFKGTDMFREQVKADEYELFEYLTDEQLTSESLESAKNSFLMDNTRKKLNQHKFTNGLIPDDEIIAYAIFLICDSDIVENANECGEIDFYDIPDLVNHIAQRIKFILLCIQNKRYDILNAIISHVKRNKADDINTLLIYPTVEANDGGVTEFVKAWTDSKAYNEFHAKECEKRRNEYEDDEEIIDEEDEDNDVENEEPIVERDFEG